MDTPPTEEVVVSGGGAGERIKRLRERVVLVEKDPESNHGLETIVFLETAALWIEVLETGSRYLVHRNATPGEGADAAQRSFVNHMDQGNVDAAVDALVRINSQAPGSLEQAAWTALGALSGELRRLASAAMSSPMPPLFSRSTTPGHLNTETYVTVWLSRAALLTEMLRTLGVFGATYDEVAAIATSVTESSEEAKAASKELEGLRDELREARAERAQGELADQFKDLYRRENLTSWGFRFVAFVFLVGAGWALFLLSDSQTPDDWQAAATHLAIATLVGGASAYAARLAAAHRGTADWAKSIQVQLETFQDFLGTIDDDETRHRVYEDFGRRVLGPPPAAGDDPGTMPTAQLVELLIAASRRPPRDGP